MTKTYRHDRLKTTVFRWWKIHGAWTNVPERFAAYSLYFGSKRLLFKPINYDDPRIK